MAGINPNKFRASLQPKSQWVVHIIRDRVTRQNHASIGTAKNLKRGRWKRANCGKLIGDMQRNPHKQGITCPKCLGIFNALDVLLSED